MENTESTKEKSTGSKPRGLIRKIVRVAVYIALSLIGLNILLYVLLSIPYIQQTVVGYATNTLKSTLKTEVSIDEIRLSLFSHVKIRGIYVEDQAKDTLLYANLIDVRLSPWKLVQTGEIAVTGIKLDDFVVNINQKDSLSDFNFQFIIDAFSSDSAQVDSTSSGGLDIRIKDLKIHRGRFNYDVLSEARTPHIFNASHIGLYDLNAYIDVQSIDMAALDVRLNSLAVRDSSGLEISSLSGRVYSKGDLLWAEDFVLSLPNSHLKTEKLSYNLETQDVQLIINDTQILAKDLEPWMPELKHLSRPLSLKADIIGKLPQLSVNNLEVSYGNECLLQTSASIANYELYAETDMVFSIDNFRISPTAITEFARIGDSNFIAPAILDSIGEIQFKGNIAGQLSNFRLDAETWIRQGALQLTANGAIDSTFEQMDITANLQTKNFNLGKLLGPEMGLGMISLHTDVHVKQTPKTGLTAELKGAVDELHYGADTIRSLNISGSYTDLLASAQIHVDGERGMLYADASYIQTKHPGVKLKLSMRDFELRRFYQNPSWIEPKLTIKVDADFQGLDNIDEITGRLRIDSLNLYGSNFKFAPGPIALDIVKVNDSIKDISLRSSLATANIKGEYEFTTLPDEISNILHKCMPSLFPRDKHGHSHGQAFDFDLTINNTQSYSKIFGLPADIIKPLTLKGKINSAKHIVMMQSNVPHIKYDNTDIYDTQIQVANKDNRFIIKTKADVQSDINMYHIGFDLMGKADTIRNTLKIARDSIGFGMHGTIDTWAHIKRDEKENLISTMYMIPSDFQFGEMTFNLKKSMMVYANDQLNIQDFAIDLNNKKFFGIDGIVSSVPSDSVKVYFSHAQIGDVLKGVNINNFAAAVNGDVYVRNILDKPQVNTTDLMIYDITVNTDTLGTISIDSEWSDKVGGFEFSAILQKKLSRVAQFDGLIPSNSDELNINLFMDRFALNWIEPFTVGLLTKVSGSVSSDIKIRGTTKNPKLDGFFGFNNTTLGIDYTNVEYTVSDSLYISPDQVGIRNLKLRDQNGNVANLNAKVTHSNFEDPKLDMKMTFQNFLVLNTANRTDSLFYGKIFASGSIDVKGNKDKMRVNMQLKNGRNSKLNILIPQTAEASEYKSVVYINTPKDTTNMDSIPINLPAIEKPMPIMLSVVLDIDPHLALGVVIDPATGDRMEMKGAGTINFTYDMAKGIMNTTGRYELSEGFVNLNLQNVKKLDFKMRKGSSLSFVGDPFKTSFNISAYRRVKADLKTLDYSFETDTSGKVEVDCDLGIAGNMNKMDLVYGISLPKANDDVKRKVSSLINTDEEKIKQFAYLIAAGTFHSSGGSSGANFTDGMWTSLASSTISSGLNAALGGVLGDNWELGTNLESTDGTFANMDMSVSVSTKLFDDKLKLNTNLGYRTDNTGVSDNSFIGDFEAEYQLNPTWTLKGFNKTNDKFYRQAPTTQGIGIMYTKDAATMKQLFQSMRQSIRRRPMNPKRRAMRDSIHRADSIRALQIDSLKPLQKENYKID